MTASHEDQVKERFSKVPLDVPMNKALYDLALARHEEAAQGHDFSAHASMELPDSDEFLEMKLKRPLGPIETIEERIQLPSLPTVLLQLQAELESQNNSTTRLAEIICMDIRLSTALLSLVNSALYSFPNKVETVERAITLMGTGEVSALAFSTRLLSMFEDTTPKVLPLETYLRHSMACATVAHQLAEACNKPEPSKYFVAGLVHDIGRPILFSAHPDMAKILFALQMQKGMPLDEGEEMVFDINHAMLGGLFLAKWGLPQSIVNAALLHHDPTACHGKETAEIVFVANQVTTALGFGCNYFYTGRPGQYIWDNLGITPDSLGNMLTGIDEKLEILFAAVFPGE